MCGTWQAANIKFQFIIILKGGGAYFTNGKAIQQDSLKQIFPSPSDPVSNDSSGVSSTFSQTPVLDHSFSLLLTARILQGHKMQQGKWLRIITLF